MKWSFCAACAGPWMRCQAAQSQQQQWQVRATMLQLHVTLVSIHPLHGSLACVGASLTRKNKCMHPRLQVPLQEKLGLATHQPWHGSHQAQLQ